MNKAKNVMVTGAGGYIGTTLVPALLAEGYNVRAIDRFFFGKELLPNDERLSLIREDSRKLTEKHFEGVDYVIDLAAVSNDPSGELFQTATWEINHVGRERCARMAKKAGAQRYILPSSCSIYGFQGDRTADETTPINPLTTYAKANGRAEDGALALVDDDFVVVVLRQATVFGLSPRMRFDLAINGMTFGAMQSGTLPLMRDGTQWRPMVHVRDTVSAQIFMLTASVEKVNGQVFNVGSARNTYQIKALAEEIAAAVPRDVKIEWYGDADHRSYRVAFDKIEALGWSAVLTAAHGVREIAETILSGKIDRDSKTITLEWYKELEERYSLIREQKAVVAHRGGPQPQFVKEVAMYGGMLNI